MYSQQKDEARKLVSSKFNVLCNGHLLSQECPFRVSVLVVCVCDIVGHVVAVASIHPCFVEFSR